MGEEATIPTIPCYLLLATAQADMLMEGYRHVEGDVIIENAGEFPGYRFHLFPEGTRADGAETLEPDPDGRIVFDFYHANPPWLFMEPTQDPAPVEDDLSRACRRFIDEARCGEAPPAFFASSGLARSGDRLMSIKAVENHSSAARVDVVYTIRAVKDGRVELELELREQTQAELDAAELGHEEESRKRALADSKERWEGAHRELLHWPPMLLSLLAAMGLGVRWRMNRTGAQDA